MTTPTPEYEVVTTWNLVTVWPLCGSVDKDSWSEPAVVDAVCMLEVVVVLVDAEELLEDVGRDANVDAEVAVVVCVSVTVCIRVTTLLGVVQRRNED